MSNRTPSLRVWLDLSCRSVHGDVTSHMSCECLNTQRGKSGETKETGETNGPVTLDPDRSLLKGSFWSVS